MVISVPLFVFSGKKGFYTLDDEPDAEDLYGVSKYKGEILVKNQFFFILLSYQRRSDYISNALFWFCCGIRCIDLKNVRASPK